MEFKNRFAEKINGIYTNITTDGELWASVCSFNTSMGWKTVAPSTTQKNSDGIMRAEWAYMKPTRSGDKGFPTIGENWLINIDGIGDMLIQRQPYCKGNELGKIRSWLMDAHGKWPEVDVAECLKLISGASSQGKTKREHRPMDDANPNALMNLVVEKHNGELYMDSRRVATAVGKEHFNLLADIRGYIKSLEKSIDMNNQFNKKYIRNPVELTNKVNEFFIESSYTDSIGRTMPCYLVTKKGCEMVANKLQGDKGVRFTAAYITKFHEMEDAINHQSCGTVSMAINPRIIPVSPFFLDFGDATALLFESADSDHPYLENFEVRQSVSNLIKVIARRNGDPTKRDTWREFYQGAEEIGKAGVTSRDKGSKAYIDLIAHEEWWAFVVQVMDMATATGVPVERYIDDERVIERFITLFQCYRMCLTLVEAREILKLAPAAQDLQII